MSDSTDQELRRLNGLIVELYGQRRYQEAVQLAQQAVALSFGGLGAEHPDTLTALNNLAVLYESQGRYGEAEPLYERALAARERTLGAEHPLTLDSLNNLAVFYYSQGRYGEAELLYERTLAARERTLGAEHPDTLVSLNNLALLYCRQGRYGEAEPLYERALAARERMLGAEHRDTLSSLNDLAALHESQGRYGEAELLYERTLTARERTLGAEHPDTLVSLNNLAVLYDTQGRYGEAEPLHERALAASERVLGAEHPQTLGSLNNLAALYKSQGRYGEAEPLLERALAARERTLGAEHPDTLVSLDVLAGLYKSQGRYGEAEPLYERALAARERTLGAEHPDTLITLNNLALLYCRQGRYGEAEPLYERALAASERALGAEHPQTLGSLNNLAVLYDGQGRYGKAEPLLERALAARERTLGAEHPDTLVSLNNLAGLYCSQERYSEAEPLYERALAGSERALGAEHPLTLSSLNNLAELYQSQGRCGEAEPLLEQALAARERTLGVEHPDTLVSLNNLAELYKSQGRYGEAEPLYERALAARERTLGAEHPDTLVSLDVLAGLYKSQGRYGDAEPLYERTRAMSERTLGAQHPSTLASLNNLALLYWSQSRYGEAQSLYERALAASERTLGAEHPKTLTSLNNLAALYDSQGRYSEAEPLYLRALTANERRLGAEHPKTLTSLNNLAALYAATGKSVEAFELLERSQQAATRQLLRRLSVSSPEQAAIAIGQSQADLYAFVSLVWREFRDSAEHVRRAVDIVLRRKALGLETARSQREALLSGRYPQLEPRIRELTALKQRLVTKTLAGPAEGEDPQQHGQTLQEWETDLERLERELARLIPEVKLDEKLRAADRQAVALALPAGATLVELLRFEVFDFQAVAARGESQWKPARYCAFVVPADEPDAVRMLDLGEAEPIDAMVRTFRRLTAGGSGAREGAEVPAAGEPSRETGKRLREAVADPAFPPHAANRGARVFIAADGELNLLPFGALRCEDGAYLGDRYELSYLGSGRDLLRYQVRAEVEAGEAVVIADPAFDLSAAEQLEESKPSGLSRELGREGIEFRPLPGTRLEGERIGRKLGVQPWFGEQALEAPLKRLGSPRLLHGATHGFFLADQHVEPAEVRQAFGFGAEAPGRLGGLGVKNPMLRSGLALAGSQSWLERKALPEEAEDGLLTAEDVATMDLRATELVVLSACQTGLGEVRHGEGVFGLRRAFVLAGAKTLVMSLWKAPDLATAILMDCFYDHLLAGEERHLALRQAQVELREITIEDLRREWLSDETIARLAPEGLAQVELRALRARPADHRPFEPVYYWGAFICEGGTAPLPRA